MARRRRNRIEEEAAQLRKQRREMLRDRKAASERRKLLMALMPILIGVFVLVAVGWFRLEWWQPRQPVARVAGTAITAETYGKRVQFARRQTLNNLSSLLGFLQSTDPSFIESYVQGQRTGVAQQTLDQMIDEELIREEAEARGITVSDEEVEERICAELSQATGATTASDDEAEADADGEDAASDEGADGEDEATADDASEDETGDEDAEGEDADGEEGADDETGDEDATTDDESSDEDESEDAAAPGDDLVCALEGAELERTFETVLEPQLDQAGMGRSDYEALVRAQIFRDKLSDSLGEELDTTAEQAEVEYMLFTDESVAADALAALETGTDWSTVKTTFTRPEEPETDEADGDDAAADEATDEDTEADEADEGAADDEDAAESDESAEAEPETEAGDDASESDEDEGEGDEGADGASDEDESEADDSSDEDGATSEDGAEPAAASDEDEAEDGQADPDPTTADDESGEDEAAEGDDAAEGEDENTDDEEAPAPPPTPEPEPYAFDISEPQWFTQEQLQTRLGLTQTEVETIFGFEPDDHSEALQGSQGFYIVHVLDKDADREIDEAELQRLRDNAMDEWLTETRLSKSSEISRFPTEGFVPEEPAWFVQGFEQLTSSLGGQAPLDLGGLDTGGAGDAGGDQSP